MAPLIGSVLALAALATALPPPAAPTNAHEARNMPSVPLWVHPDLVVRPTPMSRPGRLLDPKIVSALASLGRSNALNHSSTITTPSSSTITSSASSPTSDTSATTSSDTVTDSSTVQDDPTATALSSSTNTSSILSSSSESSTTASSISGTDSSTARQQSTTAASTFSTITSSASYSASDSSTTTSSTSLPTESCKTKWVSGGGQPLDDQCNFFNFWCVFDPIIQPHKVTTGCSSSSTSGPTSTTKTKESIKPTPTKPACADHPRGCDYRPKIPIPIDPKYYPHARPPHHPIGYRPEVQSGKPGENVPRPDDDCHSTGSCRDSTPDWLPFPGDHIPCFTGGPEGCKDHIHKEG